MARRAPGGGPEAVELLLRLASPAIRLEAGLVRDLRRLVPGADVDTEVEMWRHAGVAARSRLGLRLDRDAVRRRLGLFRELPEAVQRAVIAALIDWHRTLAPEVLAEEVLGLIAHGVPESWIGPELVERVIELIAKLCRVVERGGAPEEEFPTACEAFLVRFGGRASRPVWSYPPLRPYLARAAKALRERRPESEPSAGATPEMFIPSGEELERWALWHEGAAIRIRALGETGEGSLLATISARRGELRAGDGVSPVRALDLAGERPEFPWPGGERTVEIVSDVESLRLELWQPPEWASAAGRDEHGLWISFEVGGVEQRLRWIPPGRFQMGSSDSEEGRFEREGPRHWVVLTEGFWLAETQCTQALWEAVMGEGENPSRFEDPRQPVERVSWEACQEFLDRLSFRIPGLEVRLPTEAEWEYACRAGTETPYWSGRQGGDLERVAWYRKNSEGRTHPVGEKPANPWGLHDMLGNVYEWCWDVWGPYEPRVAVDPEGPVHGAERVLRGGSWSDHARNVRAAYRGWFPPGDRDGYLGFRLSRGQGRGASVLDGIKRSSERVGRGTSPRRRSRRDRAWVERLGWASDGGADRFGRWASFEASGVSHRLRWIPSGRCLMGSPESEAGRWEAEGPRHEVSLSEGFWLGETPCTQALWEAVTGENPSRFRSRRRPVERVSWEDCQRFFAALNERVPDLRAGLPTEAQWEHACRAGTRTATWLGDLRILGERNAPLLDTIAWYGGNSGVGYELAEAEDCSEWSETQVPSTRAGTREVGRKHPNPWGLYDMLGNVWEWCSDYWADRYPSGPRIDPRGPEEGAGRVIRGGSWGARARGVRAACRDGDPPGGRGDSLGFRLSRGQGAPGMETESENKIQAGRKAWGRSPRDEA
jgi:formylglycine-generating enzyme required for sulfatase activity